MADKAAAAAAAPDAPLGHIQAWIEEHVAPDVDRAKDDIAALKATAARVVAFCEAHAANADQLASLVAKIVSAADPAAAPVIAALQVEAARVAAEAKRIAEEFNGQPGAAL